MEKKKVKRTAINCSEVLTIAGTITNISQDKNRLFCFNIFGGKKTSDYLVNKVCHNSLSQYGQDISFFLRLKNTIPQLLHIYFFGIFIEFSLPIIYF